MTFDEVCLSLLNRAVDGKCYGFFSDPYQIRYNMDPTHPPEFIWVGGAGRRVATPAWTLGLAPSERCMGAGGCEPQLFKG